jgi:hypothetical protein
MIITDSLTRLEIKNRRFAIAEAGGDLQVSVDVIMDRFRGRNDSAWIMKSVRDGFLSELRAAEQTRRGGAILQSMSPQDFSCRIAAHDQVGHFAVSGHVGGVIVDSQSVDVARIPFRIEVDPLRLAELVGEFERLFAA